MKIISTFAQYSSEFRKLNEELEASFGSFYKRWMSEMYIKRNFIERLSKNPLEVLSEILTLMHQYRLARLN